MIPKLEKRILKYLRPQAFQARDNQLVCNRLFCKVTKYRFLSIGENLYHEVEVITEALIHSSLGSINVTLLHVIYIANLEDLTVSMNHTS